MMGMGTIRIMHSPFLLLCYPSLVPLPPHPSPMPPLLHAPPCPGSTRQHSRGPRLTGAAAGATPSHRGIPLAGDLARALLTRDAQLGLGLALESGLAIGLGLGLGIAATG